MWPKPSRTWTATWVASKIWPRRWAAWLSLHVRLTESSGNPQVVWSTAGCVQALCCVRWMCAGGPESVQAGQSSYHDNKSTRGFLDVNFQDWGGLGQVNESKGERARKVFFSPAPSPLPHNLSYSSIPGCSIILISGSLNFQSPRWRLVGEFQRVTHQNAPVLQAANEFLSTSFAAPEQLAWCDHLDDQRVQSTRVLQNSRLQSLVLSNGRRFRQTLR